MIHDYNNTNDTIKSIKHNQNNLLLFYQKSLFNICIYVSVYKILKDS